MADVSLICAHYWDFCAVQFTSVERALEYTRLPQEAERIVSDNRPPDSWPQYGAIRLENLTVRYRAGLDPVLKDVSVSISGGEKCGVVGRTGRQRNTFLNS